MQHRGPLPFSFDEVGDYLGLDTADITTFLLELELTGKISLLPGGKYFIYTKRQREQSKVKAPSMAATQTYPVDRHAREYNATQ